ncbi:segregation/condensation protein A [Neobacillus notoginsengisoli]|uniref:Segregation and condensation protein A n=1 Tax=Neobacillus notoginsengisoli TaxID=1578198 RepID=A0A417YV97_9BACI|nr:segregation/condensation protein A [Neobacillus notoginsengisoli]RHW41200.1 segregation/condensation protein A [Neobacillus notoginsengisoli]
MQYNVKIDTFEGPLDLLLHLINTLEIDIYDIPVAQITEQYLLYIHTMKELKLDLASEYLVMAATLLAIKSNMLLPKQEEELFDEGFESDYEADPRSELVERLIEYRKYKEAAIDLKSLEEERSLIYTKAPSDLSELSKGKAGPKTAGPSASLYDMLGAFQKLMRRKRLKKPLATKIARQEISIEKRMEEIIDLLKNRTDVVDFNELFPYPEKEYIVVTFLAVLELMKRNEIIAQQTENFGGIQVIPVQRGAAAVGYY